MTAGLPLMKNVLIPLDKSILIPLGLTTAALATDAAIQKKIYGLATTALIISKKEIEDIMKIVKSPEDLRLLIKWITETTTKNGAKEQKGEFLGMLLGTLAASMLGNALKEQVVIGAGEGVIRASQNHSYHLILLLNLKYKSIIKTDLSLMVFIQ